MELEQFKTDVVPLRARLLNYARKLTNETSDAEDAVQEVMLKLWGIRHRLDEYRSIEGLAITMTHHQCMDLWRRKQTDTVPIDQIRDFGQSQTPEHLLEEKDEFQLMRSLIDSLPPQQRTILLMKDVQEYEMTEIAEITGCTAEAIRSNLSRARKKVRDMYLQIIRERERRMES